MLLMAMLVPGIAAAQQQSAIVRGVVSGVDGQPVAGATVTLRDQLGVSVAATIADATGRFRLDEVPVGTYTLTAEAPPQRSEARLLTVQAALPIDVELTLAARMAESVVVQGVKDAPPVTARITIAGDAMRQLPTRLPSRGVQQMLATLPGFASEDNGLLHVRGVDDGILYVEDGVPVYDRLDAAFGIATDPASVGSINVLTGYIPAEYGLKSGAVIEVQSSATRRDGWAGSVDAGFGSDAARSLRALGAGPLGRRWSLGLSGGLDRSDRFLDPVHPDNLHNAGGVASGEAHVSALASENDLVRIKVAAGGSRHDVPHGAAQEDAGQDQRQRLRQNSQSGSWQRFWSNRVVSQASFYRRAATADLESSPFDTPLSSHSDRSQNRLGALAGLTLDRGRHTVKVGGEMARLELREHFNFAVTDVDAAEAGELSDRALEFTVDAPFLFADRVTRHQWSIYAQDRIRAGKTLTVDVGIRFDRTNLVIPASQWSPRAGIAFAPTDGTTVRGSVNRLYQPPQIEHLLLSSSVAARELSPFAGGGAQAGGSALEPERQTAWEVGVSQWVRGTVRLDAAYWSRHVRNYADPNVFFGTTIVFPNSVAAGFARGMDLRLELPHYRGWSSYASYTLAKVEQTGPINGGLFLEDTFLEIASGTRFTPDHDQRHAAAAGVTYANAQRGFSSTFAARFDSGTPLEVDEDDVGELMNRPGAELVDFEAGRVRSRMVLDVTASQTLTRRPFETSIRIAVMNVTNAGYALNFGNPFSGTHFGAPRSFRGEVRIGFD